MVKKVICTCPECIQHHTDSHGQRIPGRKVTQQLRRLHELTAAANPSPHYATTATSHPVGIDESSDNEDKVGKEKLGSSPGV